MQLFAYLMVTVVGSVVAVLGVTASNKMEAAGSRLVQTLGTFVGIWAGLSALFAFFGVGGMIFEVLGLFYR